MEEIKVYLVNYEHVSSYRRSVTVSEETHPELKGLTVDQAKDYIKENAEAMAPTDDSYDSLYDQLEQCEVENEKWNNTGQELGFE